MKLGLVLLWCLVSLALGIAWTQLNAQSGSDEPRVCFDLDQGSEPSCFFSSDYFQGRDRFRAAASSAGAKLFALPIYQHLTTDVAVFPADAEASERLGHTLLLHLSGTHGAEGFVGSGVQLSVLKDAEILRRIETFRKQGVSVAFVHAVNPYGMANWRRFNENNVDLNRNALFSKAQWDEVLGRPANIAGYEDIDDVLNPKGEPAPGQRLWLLAQAAWLILSRGFVAVKAALVTGTYQCAACVYFGGSELQPSHLRISEFLREHFVETAVPVSRLALVDVHSGLGPLGLDTLMDSPSSTEDLAAVFHRAGDPDIEQGLMAFEISGMQNDGKDVVSGASEGYDLVVGDVADNYPRLFGESLGRGVLSVTQEFGTIPGVLVALSLIEENQLWQLQKTDPRANRDAAAAGVKAAFFPSSQRFRETTVLRGRSVFKQALRWAASQPTPRAPGSQKSAPSSGSEAHVASKQDL